MISKRRIYLTLAIAVVVALTLTAGTYFWQTVVPVHHVQYRTALQPADVAVVTSSLLAFVLLYASTRDD